MNTWRPVSPEPRWKQAIPRWLLAPARLLFVIGLWAAIGISAIGFFYFLLAMRFDLGEVAKLSSTSYYDRSGAVIHVPGARQLAQREDLPEFLVKSLEAREDARFYEHRGVDLRGLLRATLRNLRDFDFTQGASTLTMQLARNTFEMRAKSLHRKLLEIALTLRIEARYSKDEILCHYLNRIYFGSGAEGIQQAAQTYFDRPVSELNEGECALVVGIIRGPAIFSPFRDYPLALEQRDQTLARLVAMGEIDEARCAEIAAMPIRLAQGARRISQRSYALKEVIAERDRILSERELQAGGLKIYTTLDIAWQARLESELNRALAELESEPNWPHPTLTQHQAGEDPGYLQYAAVTTETRTGEVLAMIGGRNFQHSGFNRIRSNRDLGSAFEPFVAAAAAERGKLVLIGKPVQTGRQIGPAEVERIARRLGINGPFLETEDLFRGAVSASPVQMSIALAALGNEGKRPKPFLIREIRDAAGKVLYHAEPRLVAGITAPAAKEALRVLKHRAGTRCFTGATGSERDAWTLRLGPSGATAIWIGFDQPKAIASAKRLDALLDEFVQRLGND